ncbi:1,2-dihydroxy-3-keto-5-methylthiopentene dioxygenase [Geopyxis carbonaria]|nr:1,2-dihydroxy-3-keto-5-methylthiopentene dioxygenase [Geopyxis carbonaria]
MKIYEYEESDADQRAPHDSGRALTAADLTALGVLSYHLPAQADVDALALSRQYKNRDVITVSPAAMGSIYEDKVKTFFAEHLHEDEEIRYILDGAGYFDVRGAGPEERWVRVRLEKGDLIILPAGIYHRFTTDEENYVQAMRLFKDEPKWTALNRDKELEANPARREYVESIAGAVAA